MNFLLILTLRLLFKQFQCAALALITSVLTLPLAWQTHAEEDTSECFASYCLESGNVDLAFALGYGVRTNPLNFSDHRSLVIVPDIAWYGENWYLDNLEVGYQWHYSASFALETFVTLNNTNRDFQDEHGSSFLFDGVDVLGAVESTAAVGPTPPPRENTSGDNETGRLHGYNITSDDIRLSPEDVKDRDFALDFGIRAHWYTQSSEWTLALFHDISDVYKGARASAGYRKLWLLGSWKLVTSAELEWRSADLLDYYYGIDSTDIDNTLFHYDAGAGLFTSVGLTANREITENWHWLLHTSFNLLPKAMTDSPLVEEDYTITTFAGVTYRF